jgi:hypothetical protein
MRHSRSRLFSPEIGGINVGTAYAPVARPDHDQGFQQTTNLQYQFSQKDLRGLWLGLNCRFDSGLVVVSVPDYATALTLTGDEQQAMGLYCGSVFARASSPCRLAFAATRRHPHSYCPGWNQPRFQPLADQTAKPLRRCRRIGQRLKERSLLLGRETNGCESHEQNRTLQFPFQLFRNSFRHSKDSPGRGHIPFLGTEGHRPPTAPEWWFVMVTADRYPISPSH